MRSPPTDVARQVELRHQLVEPGLQPGERRARHLQGHHHPVGDIGNHAEIVKWRRQRMLEATALKRPDLLDKARAAGQLSKKDEQFLAGLVKPAS